MNNSNDKVLDRIESVDRMLRNARTEHARGNDEDAATFLEVAGTRIQAALAAIQANADAAPIRLSERKESSHAR